MVNECEAMVIQLRAQIAALEQRVLELESDLEEAEHELIDERARADIADRDAAHWEGLYEDARDQC